MLAPMYLARRPDGGQTVVYPLDATMPSGAWRFDPPLTEIPDPPFPLRQGGYAAVACSETVAVMMLHQLAGRS